MCTKIESANPNTGEGNSINAITIDGAVTLQMFKEGKINPETLQISDKNIATFQDFNGKAYRSELNQAQVTSLVNTFSEKTCSEPENTEKIDNSSFPQPDLINVKKGQQGSAQTFTPLFEENQNSGKPIEIPKTNTPDNTWKFNFSMGYNRTHYYDTDMHLHSSRVDATIKNFSFQERTSSDFYNPKNWQQPMDAFRWIDEPTNSFTLSAENKNNVFSLTAFHPKFLKQQYETKQVTGTVDGVAVDKEMPINEEFDGYNDQPGQMHLTRFENTHMQMDWQLGYGRNITLLDTHKFGKLVYTPSVYAGLTSGKHYDAYVKQGQYWEFVDSEDKNKIQGANAAIGNKLKYEYGRVNVFVENKFTVSHLKHQFMDGTAEYNMKYDATTFGLGYNFYKTKPKPPAQEP